MSLMCPPTNITAGDGVFAVSCLVSPFGAPTTDLRPIVVESISILELDQSNNVLVEERIEGNLLDGDSFTYASVLNEPSFVSSPEQIPRALQMNINGRNQEGVILLNVFIITYSNECGFLPVIQAGHSAGWVVFAETGEPNFEFCPTVEPTPSPSTESPLIPPTPEPTNRATGSPSQQPSTIPTGSPTFIPTQEPSQSPSLSPTPAPITAEPTADPTRRPTNSPTIGPSLSPVTAEPTERPTGNPTLEPTSFPSVNPSFTPTSRPSILPSEMAEMTLEPTEQPIVDPTTRPTPFPSSQHPSATPSSPSPTLLMSSPVPSSSPSVSARTIEPSGMIPTTELPTIISQFPTIDMSMSMMMNFPWLESKTSIGAITSSSSRSNEIMNIGWRNHHRKRATTSIFLMSKEEESNLLSEIDLSLLEERMNRNPKRQ